MLEALGGPDERIRSTTAPTLRPRQTSTRSTCWRSRSRSSAEARVLPLTPGLADGLFEHDGQITKREIRALTLSALAPRRGELLWDIGAGSGSIGIEWMLRRSVHARHRHRGRSGARRAHRPQRRGFGVPGLTVVEGTAPAALAGLPAPDAIFIGGGGSEAGVLDAAIAALKPGGRLVANAVTLEMEAVLLARHAALGGELIRIAMSRAAPVGAMRAGGRPCRSRNGRGRSHDRRGIGCRKGVSAAEVLAAIERGA